VITDITVRDFSNCGPGAIGRRSIRARIARPQRPRCQHQRGGGAQDAVRASTPADAMPVIDRDASGPQTTPGRVLKTLTDPCLRDRACYERWIRRRPSPTPTSSTPPTSPARRCRRWSGEGRRRGRGLRPRFAWRQRAWRPARDADRAPPDAPTAAGDIFSRS
jgi:hypothetical protein